LRRHEGLTKAQSSLLTQARTGDIGLRDYLFRIKVPEGQHPLLQVRRREGNSGAPSGMVPQSTETKAVEPKGYSVTQRPANRATGGGGGAGTQDTGLKKKVLNWLMDSGRLLEYRLARKLDLETVEG